MSSIEISSIKWENNQLIQKSFNSLWRKLLLDFQVVMFRYYLVS